MEGFTLIVKSVGDLCPFRCDYCYNADPGLSDRSRTGKMDFEVLETLTANYLSQTQPFYTFLWHGGEPLLAGKPFYEEALELQRYYAKKNGLEMPIKNRLQTNAALVDANWADFFRKNGFRIGVSLDGPSEVHNAHRRYPNGRGTFSDVMDGVEALLSAGNTIGIGAVVTQVSLKDPIRFFEFFRERFTIFDFSPCFLAPEDIDSDESMAVGTEEYAEFITTLFDYWWKIDDPSIRIRSFRHYVQIGLGKTPQICSMGSGCTHYLAVDWDGRAYPCGRNASVQSLYLGNALERDLEYIREDKPYQDYLEEALRLADECRECPWLYACHNGCPASRYMGRGQFAPKTPLCETRKRIYKHVSEKVQALQEAL